MSGGVYISGIDFSDSVLLIVFNFIEIQKVTKVFHVYDVTK